MAERDKNELYILKGLLKHIDYMSRFNDKLKHEYFSIEVAPVILCLVKYFRKYQKLPTIEMVVDTHLPLVCKNNQDLIEQATSIVDEALALPFEQKEYDEHYEWLCAITKEWILNKSVEIAFVESTNLYLSGKRNEAIHKILEASHISFDDELGLDYVGDLDKRIDNLKEKKLIIPTGIETLDEAIGGGWRPKSLIMFGAATNVGKTLILGAITTNLLQQGYNGLYLTLEINDFMLANRIDANLADIPLNELNQNADRLKEIISNKMELSKRNGKEIGRLIIKEYPPATICSQNIMSLIRELEVKRGGFKPDFICVDYLALMVPNAKAFSDNTYGKLKTVSEEVRAIASKLGIPIFSATQVNRSGYDTDNEKKLGMQHTSDSMGIPCTADVMIMVSRNEDTPHLMNWYIDKSRWCKRGHSLPIFVDYDHMRIMDATAFDVTEQETKESANIIKKLNNGSGNATNIQSSIKPNFNSALK